ncbi:MAG: hypothetical protein M0030_04565 [Actinomycetota bacterium]|nr:hypothetical protein [Actinomycetota bacterium]
MAWSLFSQSQVTPLSWATAVLRAGGWPETAANKQSLIAWAINEGGGGTYNPLNSTQGPGTSFNSVGVKNYGNWQIGTAQTVATMKNGYYPNIVADLKSGKGIGGNAAGDLHTWSGGGYSAISQNWAAAAKYLGGKSAPLPAGGGIQTTAYTTSSGSGVDAGIFAAANQILAGLGYNVFPGQGSIGGLGAIGQGITAVAGGVAKVAKAIDWFFQPNNMIRLVCGVGGSVSLFSGVIVLSGVGSQVGIAVASAAGAGAPARAINQAVQPMRLPFGMILVGGGILGLFVAFHNLPSDVTNFGDLIGYLTLGPVSKAAPLTGKSAAQLGQGVVGVAQGAQQALQQSGTSVSASSGIPGKPSWAPPGTVFA